MKIDEDINIMEECLKQMRKRGSTDGQVTDDGSVLNFYCEGEVLVFEYSDNTLIVNRTGKIECDIDMREPDFDMVERMMDIYNVFIKDGSKRREERIRNSVDTPAMIEIRKRAEARSIERLEKKRSYPRLPEQSRS